MRVPPTLVCLMAFLVSLEADNCKTREEKIVFSGSANEIDSRTCPLALHEKIGPVIWYKNDSRTLIDTEQGFRIHQQKNKLWFVPAKVEDSGQYYCAVRNSTYCLKVQVTTSFMENEPSLCYFKTETVFVQKLPVERDGTIMCPFLDAFKDENNELPEIQWYKDCKPLRRNSTYFTVMKNALFVTKVLEEHGGSYICQMAYTYLGKRYNVTRAIKLIIIDDSVQNIPVIWSPSNKTIEAPLGSEIWLVCNVTTYLSDSVYWTWKGAEIDSDDPVLSEDFDFEINPSAKGKGIIISRLNISKVKSEFYLYPFTCVAENAYGTVAAYAQLIHPVPDVKNHLIGTFVTVTFVIVCSVLIYKIFKVDIVLWYRDCCYDFLPPKASDGKTYDAYILYPKTFGDGSTSNSDIFVFKILPEVLEKQCEYTLFICGRDDYVGEDSIEVANDTIRRSRRLIIVLGRDLAGFSWLGHSSEEQIVMYHALLKEGIKVVLVELEKIQDYEKMPESIKFIKQKHGVIRWSGDLRDGPQSAKTRFWKNIRYHMPAQRRSPVSKHTLLSPAAGPDARDKRQRELHLPLG